MSGIIKDGTCIELLYEIIDLYTVLAVNPSLAKQEINTADKKGLPIGNLTSQFFANFYLSGLDHFVLEQLKPCGYVRYMDDIVVFENSKERLKSIFAKIETFCSARLHLSLKLPIFGICENGVPFLGWNISCKKIKVLKNTKKRMKKKLNQIESDFLNGRASFEKTL